MTNSLPYNVSAPFNGLATQQLTVPTTSVYTVGVQVFCPWLTSDQPQAVNNPLSSNVQTITTVADSSGSLNSTFWTFYNTGNQTGYYVWYNINSAGVDPAPAGLTGIQVTGATNVIANTLAASTRTAIAAAITGWNSFTVTGATNHVILSNTVPGQCTAAADGTAATGFSFAVGTAGTFGYASGVTVQIKHGSTVIQTLGPPTPTQALLGGAQTFSATAADTISIVTASLAAVDQMPNAIKGIINIFQGPL